MMFKAKTARLILVISFAVFILLYFLIKNVLSPIEERQQDHSQLIEIKVKSENPVFDVWVNGVINSSVESLQTSLHRHFIELDANARQTSEQLTVTVVQNGEPLALEFVAINVIDHYSQADIAATRLLGQALSIEVSNEQKLVLIDRALSDETVSEWMSQHLILLRSYAQSKQQEFSNAYRSNHSYFLYLDDKLLFQCYLLSKISKQDNAEKQSNVLDFLATELIADMAKTLIEIDRRIKPVELATDTPELDLLTYRRVCADTQLRLIPEQFSDDRSFGHDLIDDAKRLLRYAIVQANETDSPLLLGRVLARMWYLHNRLGQQNEAIAVARQALHFVAHDLAAINEFVEISGQLATSLMEQGRFAETMQILGTALNKSEYADFYLRENITFANGFLYRELGEYEAAEHYFRRVLDAYRLPSLPPKRELSDTETECSTFFKKHEKSAAAKTQLGIIKRKQKQFKEAIALQRCALELFDDRGDYYQLVSQIDLAASYLGNANYALARAALPTSSLLDDAQKPQKIDAGILRLKLSYHEGDQQQSEATIDSLGMLFGHNAFFRPCPTADKVCMAAQSNYAFPIKQIRLFEVLIGESSGAEELVAFYFKRATQIINHVRQQAVIPQAWNEAQYSLVETYISALLSDASLDNGMLNRRIFEVLETYYSLQLELEKRHYVSSAQSNSEELNEAFQHWMNSEQRVLTASKPRLAHVQQQALNARAAFFRYEQAPMRGNINLAFADYSIDMVQQALQEHEVFIRYFVNQQHQFALVVLKDKVIKHSLEGLDPTFWQSLRSVSNDWPAFIESVSKASLLPYQTLAENNIEKVIIVPDHYLHLLPFSALRLPSNHGAEQLVGQRFEVVRTTSAAQYFALDEEMYSPFSGVALFASTGQISNKASEWHSNVQGMSNEWLSKLDTIPGVLEEFDAIKSLLKEEIVFEGVGNGATNQFLMSASVRNAKLLHIATHGLYNPESPNVVGLLTSPSSPNQSTDIMTLTELFSLPFSGELVVMSGCNTMLGRHYKGAGTRSLTRGFLAQGVSSVLGTLWSVSDKSTAVFMEEFYKRLRANGNNVSTALMLTKQHFMSHPRYKHPKYWSGFVLTSKSQQKETLSLAF